MSRTTEITCAVLIVVISAMGWAINHYRDNATTYKNQRDKATSALKLANETIDDMKVRQRDVSAIDAKYTGELSDANATIEALRGDVAAGRKQLRVNATCKSNATGTSGVGNGESPGLTADAELNYYRLRSGIARLTSQVNYLQDYIRQQCLR